MYRLHCRERREHQLKLYETKIPITEIKAVKLCRNHDLKYLSSEQLVSYISEVFDHLLQREKHVSSWNDNHNTKFIKLLFPQTGSCIFRENSFQT